jgi:iron complex outermembrane receptor protein
MQIRSIALAVYLSASATGGLAEEADFIEEMVVIAHPLSSEGLAQPTTVLEGEELARNVAGTLGETLINQPGIHSSSFGQAVGRPIIRGLGGARVRIMEDRIDAMDVSVSSPDHASTIEPFMADRIEVLKGPSTLLYGNGAIGGVVDVHTGRIPHEVPERVEARAEARAADNANLRTFAGLIETGTGGFAVHLDGFYREADEYEIPGYAESDALRELEGSGEEEAFGILPGSDLETSGGAGGASFVGERGFIGAAVSRLDASYGLPGGHGHEEDEGDGAEGSPLLDLEQTRVDLEGAVLEPFSGAASLNVRFGFNTYEHAEIEPTGETGTVFDNEALEARVEVVHEPVGGIDGAGGFQYAARQYSAVGEEAFVPPVDSDSVGIFYVGQRSFANVDLEGGIRYEHASHEPQFGQTRRFDLGAASIGLVAPFESGWMIAAQFDYSTRAPTVEELFSDGPHLATRSYEVGDPELDEERAANVSATVQFDGDRFTIGASVYYTDFADFIFQEPNGDIIDDLPVFEWRQAGATFRGVDLEVEFDLIQWDAGGFSVRGFYDVVRARLKEGDERDLPRIPPERFGIGGRLEWGQFTATLDYARSADQNHIAAFELPTRGFDDLRAYLGFRVPLGESLLEFFIAGRNLTDDEQRHHTSFIKDFAPQPGRTVEGGIRVVL